jgi:hypothetical protein
MGTKLQPVATKTHTITTTEYLITVDDLYKAFDIPKGAKVFVEVPGGGDWSNTDLDISEHPIKVIGIQEEHS